MRLRSPPSLTFALLVDMIMFKVCVCVYVLGFDVSLGTGSVVTLDQKIR